MTYKNEIVGGDGKRRYRLTKTDGTSESGVLIEKDYTPLQEGSLFGAEEANALTADVNLTIGQSQEATAAANTAATAANTAATAANTAKTAADAATGKANVAATAANTAAGKATTEAGKATTAAGAANTAAIRANDAAEKAEAAYDKSAIPQSEKGAANGVATLNAESKVNQHVPAANIDDILTVEHGGTGAESLSNITVGNATKLGGKAASEFAVLSASLTNGALLKYDGTKLVRAVDGTDYITATRGTTNGWRWVKYSNGWAECHLKASKACAVNNKWGVLYESIGFAPPDFPFPFVEIPDCYPVPLDSCLIETSSTATKTSPGVLIILRPDSVPTATRAWIYGIHASGRWK